LHLQTSTSATPQRPGEMNMSMNIDTNTNKDGNNRLTTAAIIGFGRVGTALATALDSFGYTVRVVTKEPQLDKTVAVNGKEIAVSTLAEAARDAEVVFITTPDGVIKDIAANLTEMELNVRAVLHMSGSLTSQVLAALTAKKIAVGSLHPLQSFASVEQAIRNLPGSYFTFDGDETLIPWVEVLVKELQGVLNILPSAEAKVVYHAGACIVSNYLVGLAQLGVDCLTHAGFEPEQAQEALLPLMQGTLNNIAGLPLTKALTGPISRGDIEVVQSHLQALERDLPTVKKPYCALTPVLADIAKQAGGLTEEQHHKLLTMLD